MVVFINLGLLRCGKSCRLRWMNYLRPNIRRGGFSLEEEETIIQMYAQIGGRYYQKPFNLSYIYI